MVRHPAFRKILLCLGLEVAALMGAPLRPDEIEDLLRAGQQARIEASVLQERPDHPAD